MLSAHWKRWGKKVEVRQSGCCHASENSPRHACLHLSRQHGSPGWCSMLEFNGVQGSCVTLSEKPCVKENIEGAVKPQGNPLEAQFCPVSCQSLLLKALSLAWLRAKWEKSPGVPWQRVPHATSTHTTAGPGRGSGNTSGDPGDGHNTEYPIHTHLAPSLQHNHLCNEVVTTPCGCSPHPLLQEWKGSSRFLAAFPIPIGTAHRHPCPPPRGRCDWAVRCSSLFPWDHSAVRFCWPGWLPQEVRNTDDTGSTEYGWYRIHLQGPRGS